MQYIVGRTILIGALAAIAGASWFVLTRGGKAPRPPRHVVLITLDTTRADHLGSYGAADAQTRHLDALAASGARFTNAVTTAPVTGPAHAAILTGMYPARFGVRDNVTTPLPDEATTLAEQLSTAGFETAGFVGAFVVDRPYGFAQGFATFGGFDRVDSGTEANAERPGGEVVDDAVRWLEAAPTDQPLFLWAHFYDPHTPYAAPAPYGQSFADRPYDGEIAYVDHQVGRLIDAVTAKGLIDDTLFVVVADHGESLGEHGEDEHGVFLYEPVIRVPLILSGAGIPRAIVIDEQVSVIDIVPTVMTLLGVQTPPDLDGESLAGLLTGGSRATIPVAYAESYYPKYHYGWSELRSIRADGWKVIDAPRPELYRLADDPGESRNLFEEQDALGSRMVSEAQRFEQELTGGRSVEPPAPDRDTLARLRSLGYVGTSASVPSATGRGPDPKDRIAERRTFKRLLTGAIDDLAAGRLDQAGRALRDLVAINDRAYDLHQLLGEVYQRQGRREDALGEFEMASHLNPAAATPHLSAAELLLASGRLDEARRRLESARTIDPQSFDVAVVTGRLREAEGNAEAAVAAYQSAIAINPANPHPRMLLAGAASRINRLDLAEQQLQELLRMGYQPSRTNFALGQIAQMQGHTDAARRYYQEALRLEPGLTMAAEALKRLR
jgi:arylsulfatase A-like enzyme/Tfp pilus assembly protein PilF